MASAAAVADVSQFERVGAVGGSRESQLSVTGKARRIVFEGKFFAGRIGEPERGVKRRIETPGEDFNTDRLPLRQIQADEFWLQRIDVPIHATGCRQLV